MTALLIVGLAVLSGALSALWWAEAADRRRADTDRQRWRARRRAVHAGRCPWSGRPGVIDPDEAWLVECPRCGWISPSYDGAQVLPDHDDNRSR